MSEVALQLKHVGKQYRLFQSPSEKALDMLGLRWMRFWKPIKYTEFWALRDVDLTLHRGEKLGVVGSNGAGKSTMLKIVAGTIQPTAGDVAVHGKIQALMDLGTGFHPEFTGRENVRVSLAYLGWSPEEIAEREEGIIEFTELDEFIDQPVKSYSAGMHARLAFTVATSIKPDILIIDEILGAGDAYFVNKCVDRMKELTREGTTLLLASHSSAQVLQFCERAIWLDRGRIIMSGTAMEIVKAYDGFVRAQENRRLKAKNLKVNMRNYDYSKIVASGDCFYFKLRPAGDANPERFAIHALELTENGEKIEDILVGQSQDAQPTHPAYILGTTWRKPMRLNGEWGRAIDPGKEAGAFFNLFAYNQDSEYALKVEHTTGDGAGVDVEVNDGYRYVPVGRLGGNGASAKQTTTLTLPRGLYKITQRDREPKPGTAGRWEGSGEVKILRGWMLDGKGEERGVFEAGEELQIRFSYRCEGDDGPYDIIFTAVIYRQDGIRVACCISDAERIELKKGEERTATLKLPALNLGNGAYLVSPAIYKELDQELMRDAKCYDLLAWSFEFQVAGRPPMDASVFRHPHEWEFS